MKTGYSKICINPPYGAPICGYYETRRVKGILDNLYARAVAFDDSEGGYEARGSSLKPGCDDIVVDGMLSLLNSL